MVDTWPVSTTKQSGLPDDHETLTGSATSLEAREYAGKRPIASGHRPTARGVRGKHLGDQEELVASPGNRFGDHLLGGAGSVHLGGIDMVHAEIKALAQCGYSNSAIGLVDVPGALADRRDIALRGTE